MEASLQALTGKPQRKTWLRGEESAEGIVPVLERAEGPEAIGSEGEIPLIGVAISLGVE